jgi:hypothetical protein
MNPLIEKFEEVYGKKPKEGGLIEQLAGEDTINFGTHLPGGMGDDVISLGGDTVIPTAKRLPGGGINLTGDYIDSSAFVSNRMTLSSFTPTISAHKRGFEISNQTPVEQQFCKVMDNLANGKATVVSINAEIDQSFTGFGGQIRYTVEIIGTYP